jgi:hypothetical protein
VGALHDENEYLEENGGFEFKQFWLSELKKHSSAEKSVAVSRRELLLDTAPPASEKRGVWWDDY